MVKFISEEALLEIKNNKAVLYKEVVSGKKTLQEAFNSEKIVRETNIASDDFELDMSADRPETTDVENIKRVHKHMSALSESQASDERIWSAYTLSVFADYMRYRWPAESETAMMNHYFFSYSPKRSLFRNGIARLWWIGHLTYDASSIVRAVIKALMDSEAEGVPVDREVVRKASEYINILGGTYLVDALSFDTVYTKTKEVIKKASAAKKAE